MNSYLENIGEGKPISYIYSKNTHFSSSSKYVDLKSPKS